MSIENKEQRDGNPRMYSFKDGRFSFWEGDIVGKTVVIRVREDDKPFSRWVEKGLPRGITIREADEEYIQQWLTGHPHHELIKE